MSTMKVQARFDSLVAKRQANTLTAEEHQELIETTDQIENNLMSNGCSLWPN